MRIISKDEIEYSEVSYNELYGDMRIDSQYYEPFYLRNAEKIAAKPHKAVKDFMFTPQYGISIAMNEECKGFKILKMDDIIGILANDEKVKYADISQKLFDQFRLKKYDVLFNRVNSDEFVGRTGIYLLEGEHTFASYLVRITSEHTYQNFYFTVFLNCSYGNHALQRVKRRAVNQANINAQELKELIVPFPQIEFQKAIEKLIIEAHTEKLNSVNYYKQANKILLMELGLDKWQPTADIFKISNTIYQTDKSISTVLFSDVGSLDRIDAEYWQDYLVELEEKIASYKHGCRTLGEVCNIHDRNFIPEKEMEYKYIELANIGLFGNILGHTKALGGYLPTRARRLVRPGHVVVSSIEGSLSSCALITNEYDKAICSSGFHVIDSDIINSETLTVLLKSEPFQHLLKKGCNGTILTAINKRFFSLIPIPHIPKETQKEILIKIQDMYKKQFRANQLIEVAKRSVEIYIEQDEKAGLKFINENT